LNAKKKLLEEIAEMRRQSTLDAFRSRSHKPARHKKTFRSEDEELGSTNTARKLKEERKGQQRA